MKICSSMTSFRFRDANLGDTRTKMLKFGSLVKFLVSIIFGNTFGSLTFFCSFLVLTKKMLGNDPKLHRFSDNFFNISLESGEQAPLPDPSFFLYWFASFKKKIPFYPLQILAHYKYHFFMSVFFNFTMITL